MRQHKRNITGLLEAAQSKRNNAYTRVDTALEALHNEGLAITFSGIARAASVTKAWLYRQPELQEQIEKLRASTLQQPREPRSNSIDSKDAMISHLKNRTKTLEVENAELRKQLEIVYGELHQCKK